MEIKNWQLLVLLVLVVSITLGWLFLGISILSTVHVSLPGTNVLKLTPLNEVVIDTTDITSLRFCSKNRFSLNEGFDRFDSEITGSPDCHYEVYYDVKFTGDFTNRRVFNVEDGRAIMYFSKGVAYSYLRDYRVHEYFLLISTFLVLVLLIVLSIFVGAVFHYLKGAKTGNKR